MCIYDNNALKKNQKVVKNDRLREGALTSLSLLGKHTSIIHKRRGGFTGKTMKSDNKYLKYYHNIQRRISFFTFSIKIKRKCKIEQKW